MCGHRNIAGSEDGKADTYCFGFSTWDIRESNLIYCTISSVSFPSVLSVFHLLLPLSLSYRLQAWLFGEEATVEIIVKKVLVDQLVYNPVSSLAFFFLLSIVWYLAFAVSVLSLCCLCAVLSLSAIFSGAVYFSLDGMLLTFRVKNGKLISVIAILFLFVRLPCWRLYG